MSKKKIHHKVLDEVSTHGAIEAVKLLTGVGVHVISAADLVTTGGLIYPTKWASGKLIDKAMGIENLKVVDPDTGNVVKMTGKFRRTVEGNIIPIKLVSMPKVVLTGESLEKRLHAKEMARFRRLEEKARTAEAKNLGEINIAQERMQRELRRIHQTLATRRLQVHARHQRHHRERLLKG